MALTRRPAQTASKQAFTLIELLVVIAIIAILTAILLPVFASVREGARQSTSISNMKDIQQKMEQFKLDNHRYPDVLFGYAIPTGYTDSTTSLRNALSKAQAYDAAHGTNQAKIAFSGLYPAYIKDPEEFTDPNNTVNSSDTNKITTGLAENIIAPCSPASDETLTGSSTSLCTPMPVGGSTSSVSPGPGSTVLSFRRFYVADAYDSSPRVLGTNQIADTTTQNDSVTFVRYQIAREGTACSGNNQPYGCSPYTSATDANYKRQLRWQNPPSDTVITATTYHVKNADKVLLMFESGAVKKMTGADFAVQDTQGGYSGSNFWTLTP